VRARVSHWDTGGILPKTTSQNRKSLDEEVGSCLVREVRSRNPRSLNFRFKNKPVFFFSGVEGYVCRCLWDGFEQSRLLCADMARGEAQFKQLDCLFTSC
jgi:hypothetical protein